MKAIQIQQYGGPEVLTLKEVPTPEPKTGEVVIKMAASGVNYADLLTRQGGYGSAELPIVPGYEMAGTVAALGPGVSNVTLGSRVVAQVNGGYAEYAVANAAGVVQLPDKLGFGEATALFIQGLTALLILTDAARLQPGQPVLINAGAGGVGSLAIQLAKIFKAGPIIGTSSTPDKLDYIRQLGADAAIDYTQPEWTQKVSAASNGGVALALDANGGQVGEQTLQTLAPFGQLVAYGAASGQPTAYTFQQLAFKNLSVRGFTLYAFDQQRLGQGLAQLMGYVQDGSLKLNVGESYPLDQAAAAHEAMAARRTVGKVVLTA